MRPRSLVTLVLCLCSIISLGLFAPIGPRALAAWGVPLAAAPAPQQAREVVWVEDGTPAGATLYGYGDWWYWYGASHTPAPYSGNFAHESSLAADIHQHYFAGATETLAVNAGDKLVAYVYLDPANPPSEVMLQWCDGPGGWEHRAYWGQNLIPWGAEGTDSRRYMGGLPPAGRWVRLEVPAEQVGLEGRTLHGMAFTLHGGRATWDRAGKVSGAGRSNVALASNGASAGASSTYTGSGYPPSAVIDGERRGANWGWGGGWNDGTPNQFPDHFWVDFSGPKRIDEINVFSVQDNYTSPQEPTLDMAFQNFGLIDFDVYYLNDAAQYIPLEIVRGNNRVWRGIKFAPVVTTRVLVYIHRAADGYSRLTEVEAWGADAYPEAAGDIVWVEDAVPAGAIEGGHADAWSWGSYPLPVTGNVAHQSSAGGDLHQHYFYGTTQTLAVNYGDTLVAYVYLDPANPPSEVMLQWYENGSWEHRAYWKASPGSQIPWGTEGTASRRYIGMLPHAGRWVRLEVPASQVGLEGRVLDGMAFTLYGGRAAWDHAGKSSADRRANVALASLGGVATASSTTPASDGLGNYEPHSAINGERRAQSTAGSYSDNMYWRDATPDAYPDALLVNFQGAKTIDEINVYTLQDNYVYSVEPTESLTFTHYGITDYEVQYWTGAQWLTVPGGSVTGNNRVWRRFNFLPVKTSALRVLVHGALYGRSRVVEVEAWGYTAAPQTPTPPPPTPTPTPAPPPLISIGDAAQPEGNEDASDMVFVVSLSRATGQTVSVDYSTFDGTAVDQDDYFAVGGTVTFLPGETSKIITVPVSGDESVEANENFTVALSSPVNAGVGDGQATGTITNDDEFQNEPGPSGNSPVMNILPHAQGSKDLNFRIRLTGFSVFQEPNKYRVYGTGNFQMYKLVPKDINVEPVGETHKLDSLYGLTGSYPYGLNEVGRSDCSHSKDPRLWSSKCSSDAIGYFWKRISCTTGVPCQDNNWWNAAPGTVNFSTFFRSSSSTGTSPAWPSETDFGTVGYSPIIDSAKLNSVQVQPYDTNCVQGKDTIWLDDTLPRGAVANPSPTPATTESWNWVFPTPQPTPFPWPTATPTPMTPGTGASFPPAPNAGWYSHQSVNATGHKEHRFTNTTNLANNLPVGSLDRLIAYVYIHPNPTNPTKEIMLKWRDNNSSWEHRAYWGENRINEGADATAARYRVGNLPPTGQWVRLEVPASSVGLGGKTVTGMSFAVFDGQVTWDRAGKTTPAAVTRCPPKTGNPATGSHHAYNPDDYATGASNAKVAQVTYSDGTKRWFMAFNWMMKFVRVTYTTASGGKATLSQFGSTAADNWRVMWATSTNGADWTIHPQILFRTNKEVNYYAGLLVTDMLVDGNYFYILFHDIERPNLYLARAPIDLANPTSPAGYKQDNASPNNPELGWSIAAEPLVNGQYTWKRVNLGQKIDFDNLDGAYTKAYKVMPSRLGASAMFVKQGSIARIFKTSSSTPADSKIFGVTHDYSTVQKTDERIQLWSTTDLSRPFTYESDVVMDSALEQGGNGWEFGFTRHASSASTTLRNNATGFTVWVAEKPLPGEQKAPLLLTRRKAKILNY